MKKIEEVMTKENLITAPENTTIGEAKDILKSHKIEKLPLVDKDNNLRGLITIKDIEKVKNSLIALKIIGEDFYVVQRLELQRI